MNTATTPRLLLLLACGCFLAAVIAAQSMNADGGATAASGADDNSNKEIADAQNRADKKDVQHSMIRASAVVNFLAHLMEYFDTFSVLLDVMTVPVEIQWRPRYGFSVVASTDVSEGSFLLHIPQESALSRDIVLAQEPYRTMFKGLGDVDGSESLSDAAIIATYLMMEQNWAKFDRRDMPLAPWMDLIYMSDDGDTSSDICGSYAKVGKYEVEALVRQEWDTVQLLRQSTGTFESFSRALFYVLSRSFDLGNDKLEMVPYLDMFNHHPTRAAYLKKYPADMGNYYEVVADRNYRAGEQIFLNYGPYPNWFLHYRYRFAVKNNPYDELIVPLPLSHPFVSDHRDILVATLPLKDNGQPCLVVKNDLSLAENQEETLRQACLAHTDCNMNEIESCNTELGNQESVNLDHCVDSFILEVVQQQYEDYHGECVSDDGTVLIKQSPSVVLERRFYERYIGHLREKLHGATSA